MTEDEFREDHATRIGKALKMTQDKIDAYDKIQSSDLADEVREGVKEQMQIHKFIYASLEELTQLRARFEELNKGFIDVDGERVIGCTPYTVERLKHMMNFMAENGKKSEVIIATLRKEIVELTGENKNERNYA